ncbi:MAG: phosphatidylglycerophosphate synthase [Planctomycetes bacterium SCN 63-9]|nr:MAG: phosphatidylglycerophosphate synthase [Planctomycetes bacterium SCN 63-9]
MNHDSPRLSELRSRAQKGRHREIGNILARKYARPTAIYGTWLAVRLGLSAHQVTLAALASSLGGAIAIGSGDRLGFITGVLLLHLAFWLDHVDGQVARWRGTTSLDGVYFDYLMHHAANLVLGFAIGFGLSACTGDLHWTIAGFAMAFGWGLLSLHNDCRYKAFFQRLKSIHGSYRVDGGSGGRPSPPTPPPRRLRAWIVWSAYKSCEHHVVLLGLTGLAALALIVPSLWIPCWKLSAVFMAVISPTLATARIGRSIVKQSTEDEFSRWFRRISS